MIQLIEVDLQLLIHIFVSIRVEELIEQDSRISKFNYRSRKYYSIDKALLEKRLLYESSKWAQKESIHIVTNLSACYDRQLSSIESMVVELVKVGRKISLIIAKLLPSF